MKWAIVFFPLVFSLGAAATDIKCAHQTVFTNSDGSTTLGGLSFQYSGYTYPLEGDLSGICRYCGFTTYVTSQVGPFAQGAHIDAQGRFTGLMSFWTVGTITCR